MTYMGTSCTCICEQIWCELLKNLLSGVQLRVRLAIKSFKLYSFADLRVRGRHNWIHSIMSGIRCAQHLHTIQTLEHTGSFLPSQLLLSQVYDDV